MDNADLEMLSLQPGKMRPKFSRKVTEYSVVLGSAATFVKFEIFTDDEGASYEIMGHGGSKTINLKDGVNTVVIEVTAPDGVTIKRYRVAITKLASNLAELQNITISAGKLDRPFDKNKTEYYVTVGWGVAEILVTPVKFDPKSTVDIDGDPPENKIKLRPDETIIRVNILSPDGTVRKKSDTWYRPIGDFPKYECDVCSGLKQNAKCVAQCNHSFCSVCLEVTQRYDKSCPKCGRIQETPPYEYPDNHTNLKILKFGVRCFLCDADVRFNELSNHATSCKKALVWCEKCGMATTKDNNHQTCVISCKHCQQNFLKGQNHEHHCVQNPSSKKNPAIKHVIEIESWETKLRLEGGSTYDEILDQASVHESAYLKAKANATSFEPLKELLTEAAKCYATAISIRPTIPVGHYRLGLMMEELYFLTDVMFKQAIKPEAGALDCTNLVAKNSSKEEEVNAIAELHGVRKNKPLAAKLQALDAEYQSLKDQGDSFQADRVQELYAWKSKQATAKERSSLIASSTTSYIGRAYQKYADAVSLEPVSYAYNYSYAKSLIARNKYGDAVTRLNLCYGTKPLKIHIRYLLGMSMLLNNSDDGIPFLREGTTAYQQWISFNKKFDEKEKIDFEGEKEFFLLDPLFIRGFLVLSKAEKEMTTKKDLLRTVVYIVPRILRLIPNRSETYLSFELALITALASLVKLSDPPRLSIFCARLDMLIKRSPNKGNKDLLKMQANASMKRVFVEPNNAGSLTMLGDAFLALCEMSSDPVMLKDAEACYRAAINAEGASRSSSVVPPEVQNMAWYKDRTEALDPLPTNIRKGSQTPKGSPLARVRTGSDRPTRYSIQASPATTASGRRSLAVAQSSTKPDDRSRGSIAATGTSPGRMSIVPKVEENLLETEDTKEIVNAKSYLPRLGLARVLGLKSNKKRDEQKQLYKEVIELVPKLHDAYIELGELYGSCIEAAELYGSYPFSAPLTYDDAYLHGEAIRIFMKLKNYDDVRLERALIGYGQVMGWGVLDSYVRTLEDAGKTDILKRVYCAVNDKLTTDPNVVEFFNARVW